MSLEIEGEVVQRLEPDEVDGYVMPEEVRQHADDRTLLVVRASRHHPARFAWSIPLLEDVVGFLSEPLVALGLLEPVESFVVAVREPDLEVGEETSLKVTPVVLDGPVSTIQGDSSDVLLYFPTRDVEPRLRDIERALTDSGRSA
jgi:hypothetical protein